MIFIGLAAAHMYQLKERMNSRINLADESYAEIVKVLAEIFTPRIGHLDEPHQTEVRDLKDDPNLFNNEKTVTLLFDENLGAQNFSKTWLNDCIEASKEVVIERIRMIKKIHEVRKTIATQCFIGIVGPINSGKSTFINAMWQLNSPTGSSVHTDKPTIRKITETVQVVDYPGNNSLECHSRTFSICGAMNNLIVINIATSGKFTFEVV